MKQRTLEEDDVHKQIYGWSENGSDEGSLLAVEGRSLVATYESRACIFGRSAKLFGAKKIKNEIYKKWSHSTKVLCKAQHVD